MNSTKICQEVRLLLLARRTQLMLTDAILGLVAKGIYLAAKHKALAPTDKDRFLEKLDSFAGSDDITEAIQPLRYRYEFSNKFGELRKGHMSQLLRETGGRAASNRASRSDLMLLKDYSYTFRELSPLFEMLREARNYYAHNTVDREDIGWNGLIISALTRILERGTFLDKQRVEERAELRSEVTQLFTQLVKAHSEPKLNGDESGALEARANETEEVTAELPPTFIATIQGLSSNQAELMATVATVESQLNSIHDYVETLSAAVTQPLATEPKQETIQSDKHHDSAMDGTSADKSRNTMTDVVEEHTEEHELDDTPILANETLISIDMLYEELQALKAKIKARYEGDSRWIGPSSNLLQRAIVTAIVTNEPKSISEILNYDDVKWRIKKEKELLNEQIQKYDKPINELLGKTAWQRDYQLT